MAVGLVEGRAAAREPRERWRAAERRQGALRAVQRATPRALEARGVARS